FIIKLLGSRNLEKREVAKDILKRFANIEIKNIQSKPYSAYKKAVAQFLVSLYELMENKLTEEERRIKIDNLINTLYSGYGRDFIELALKINDEAIREVALIVIAEFLKTSKNEVINEILSGLVNKYARHILNKTHSWRPIWQFLFGCFVSIFDIQRAKKNYLIPALITYQMNLEYLKSAHSIREAPNIVKLISGLLILREIFALFISTAQGLNEDGSINWHIWGDNKILTEECALRLAKKYNYHFEKLTCIIKTHENSLNELAGLLSQNKIVDFDFDKFYRQKYLSIRLQGKEFIFTIREKEDWIIIEVFDYIKTYSPKLHFVGHIDIRSSDNGMEIVTDFNCEGEENIPINKQIEDYLLRIGINRQNIEEAFNIKNRTEKVNAIEVNWNYRNRCLGSILMLCAFAIAYKKDIKTVDIFPYPYEKKEFYKKFIKEDSFLVVNRHIIGFIPESLKDKIKLKDSEIIIEGLRDGNIHFIIIPYEKIQTIFEKLIYIYLKIIINIRFIFQYILIRERSYKVTTIESAELNRITTGIINFIKGINFNNDKLWQLRLIIDELVTNIYKHANNIGIIIVRLLKQKEGIEVIARDYGPGFDLSRIKTKSEELEFKDSGRGLFIVISLADKTVILSKEIGKKAQKLTFTRQIISDSIEIKREFENRKLFIRGTEVRVIIYSNKRGLSNNKEKTDVSIKPLGLNCFINIGNIDFSKYPKACGINIYDENLHKMDYYSEYKTVEEINVAYKNNQVLTLEELKNYFAEYVNQEMDVPKALWELLEKYPQALYICPSILNEIRGPPVIWRLWSGDIKKCVFSCIYSKQIYIPVTLIVFLVENKKLYLLEDILNFESDNLFTYTEDILQGEKLAKRLLKLIGEEKLSGYDEYNKLLSGAKDAINLEFNKFDILSFEKSSEELNIPIGLELEINWDINKILRMQKLPYRIIKLPINLPQYPDECKNEPEISLNPTFNQTIQLWMVKEIKKELNLEDKDITSMQVNLGIESEIWDKCSKERKGKIINDAITLMWLTVMGFVSIERIKNKKTHKVVTLREKSKLNGRFYERLEYGFADIHNISFIVFALQYLHSALLNYHFIEEEVLDMYPEWKIRMAELWGKNIDFINSKINNLKLNTGIELNYAKNNRNNLIQYLNDHEEEREEIKNYLIKLIKNCKDIYENYKITPLIKEENKIIPSFSVKTIFYPCCGMDSDFVNLILNLFPYIENIYLLDNCSQFPLTLIKEDFSKMFKDKGYIIKREDNYKLNRLKYKIEYYNDENKKSIQLYFYKKNFNKKSKIPIKADLTIVKYPGWYGELSFKEVFYSNIFKNTKDAGYILINEAYLPSSKWGFVRKLEKIAVEKIKEIILPYRKDNRIPEDYIVIYKKRGKHENNRKLNIHSQEIINHVRILRLDEKNLNKLTDFIHMLELLEQNFRDKLAVIDFTIDGNLVIRWNSKLGKKDKEIRRNIYKILKWRGYNSKEIERFIELVNGYKEKQLEVLKELGVQERLDISEEEAKRATDIANAWLIDSLSYKKIIRRKFLGILVRFLYSPSLWLWQFYKEKLDNILSGKGNWLILKESRDVIILLIISDRYSKNPDKHYKEEINNNDNENKSLLISSLFSLNRLYFKYPRLTAYVFAPLLENLCLALPSVLILWLLPSLWALCMVSLTVFITVLYLTFYFHRLVFIGKDKTPTIATRNEQKKIFRYFSGIGVPFILMAGLKLIPYFNLLIMNMPIIFFSVVIGIYLVGVLSHSLHNLWVRYGYKSVLFIGQMMGNGSVENISPLDNITKIHMIAEKIGFPLKITFGTSEEHYQTYFFLRDDLKLKEKFKLISNEPGLIVPLVIVDAHTDDDPL
ncbi:MAG: ATP-binding protein, partial [Candidatus Omnitrophica bacterium]|nr:ATP-binding protein [Candidatus Omnitrophota bacterium]